MGNSKSLRTWKKNTTRKYSLNSYQQSCFLICSCFKLINFFLEGLVKKKNKLHGLIMLGRKGQTLQNYLRLRRKEEEIAMYNIGCHIGFQNLSFITFSSWFLLLKKGTIDFYLLILCSEYLNSLLVILVCLHILLCDLCRQSWHPWK